MLGKAKELRFSDINPFLPAAVERTLEGLSEVGMGWCLLCVGRDALVYSLIEVGEVRVPILHSMPLI